MMSTLVIMYEIHKEILYFHWIQLIDNVYRLMQRVKYHQLCWVDNLYKISMVKQLDHGSF
jgi:hypothetical protein